MSTPISVGQYILRRISQLGVRDVFCVPGDFNMPLLDIVLDDKVASLSLVDTCNELNAAYAADGYARVNGIGALITTFGVGELSAINGIAGSYSERIPVVHIVGTPSTKAQRNEVLLHHTLGSGDYTVFPSIYRYLTTGTLTITSLSTQTPREIDWLLSQCVIQSAPVYLAVAVDLVNQALPQQDHVKSLLAKPLVPQLPPNPEESEKEVIGEIKRLYNQAKCPVALIDSCTVKHHTYEQVRQLISCLKIPFLTTPMAKGIIDEDIDLFAGVYIGSLTPAGLRQWVEESADLIISIGALKSDFNTGNFSYHIKQENVIELHSDHTIIRYARYDKVGMKLLIPKLCEQLSKGESKSAARLPPPLSSPLTTSSFQELLGKRRNSGEVVAHSWFWPMISQKLLQKGDVIVADLGTSVFGLLGIRFPAGVHFINQILWGSIGFSVGAALGAAVAARHQDDHPRTLLFVGDGAFQLSGQEVSTMLRLGNLPIIIFLLNNDGYTIERLIHGADRPYNCIPSWNYLQTLQYFGKTDLWKARRNGAVCERVSNQRELEQVLHVLNSNKEVAQTVSFVEVIMDKLDAPKLLSLQAKVTSRYNEDTQ